MQAEKELKRKEREQEFCFGNTFTDQNNPKHNPNRQTADPLWGSPEQEQEWKEWNGQEQQRKARAAVRRQEMKARAAP